MAFFGPLKTGLFPPPALAKHVLSLPYDVMDRAEARDMAAQADAASGKPTSFLHVIRPDIDAEGDIHGEAVYQQGAVALKRFVQQGFLKAETSRYLLYQQTWQGHTQTGLVGVASVDDYRAGIVKKHEHTRPVKVKDRVALMTAMQAQTGPVFLAHRQTPDLEVLFADLLEQGAILYDFEDAFGVRNVMYAIDKPDLIKRTGEAFANVPALYIADGHHRSESAAAYSEQQRQAGYDNGDEAHNFFLSVTYPHTDLKVLPYNRVVQDLNGHTPEALLAAIRDSFDISEVGETFDGVKEPKTFGMYLGGKWYLLKARESIIDSGDAVQSLDVALLQNYVLGPLLAIDDPKTSERVNFIGGIRGDQKLMSLVDKGDMAIAFSMYPTSMEQVMDVADRGEVMPPKSTWFEPKVRSGAAVNHLS